MKLGFIKNIQFTKLIKVDGRLREFNFRKPNGKEEGLFTVDVIDDRANRIVFHMKKIEGRWKITPEEFPAWIGNLEDSFHEIIEEEFARLQ